METWKDIKDYEGLYQVSDYGRVKSLPRQGTQTKEERILKPEKTKKGYLQVHLCKNGKVKVFRVNRLVAIAFVPNPENKPEVNHKDTNKENNHASNLEWNTRSENQLHAYKTGIQRPKLSKDNILSKKVLQYDLEGNFIKEWNCTKDIQRELNIKNQYISACCLGKTKTTHNYIFRYKDAQ